MTGPPPNPSSACRASENNYFTEMCNGSEAGSYLRLIDFVYHSTLGVRVIKKKTPMTGPPPNPSSACRARFLMSEVPL